MNFSPKNRLLKHCQDFSQASSHVNVNVKVYGSFGHESIRFATATSDDESRWKLMTKRRHTKTLRAMTPRHRVQIYLGSSFFHASFFEVRHVCSRFGVFLGIPKPLTGPPRPNAVHFQTAFSSKAHSTELQVDHQLDQPLGKRFAGATTPHTGSDLISLGPGKENKRNRHSIELGAGFSLDTEGVAGFDEVVALAVEAMFG